MPSEPRQTSSLLAEPNRLAVFATVVCVLSVAAAVVSFAKGYWIGVVWVLLAGLSSNMTYFYVRRARLARDRDRDRDPDPAG
ncbi:hypothetical protein O7599_30145 [Streptomyces sp. WMMC500]|uniref:hypothetical protein n=1 Tax=Streptomyces sp. WMMC500 TaxID=3015154 RepID=UPI00248BE4F0|nr:hypothetical protein [Streptomyces sp. WMMC500]WBB59771.1 hypothetical protein O7599_30145 [Streptomyces sp. WMMC500]